LRWKSETAPLARQVELAPEALEEGRLDGRDHHAAPLAGGIAQGR